MKYIILKGVSDRDFIAEVQEDGSYKKIAQLFGTGPAAIVGEANQYVEAHKSGIL
jgi:hypothetical protein